MQGNESSLLKGRSEPSYTALDFSAGIYQPTIFESN
jgi:hypothetical protein